MGLRDRLFRRDDRFGLTGGLRRRGETRRDFLERMSRKRAAFVPIEVYAELVDLHDRMTQLEARLDGEGRNG